MFEMNCRESEMALVFQCARPHVSEANVILCDPLLPFIRLQSISQSDFAGLSHSAGSTQNRRPRIWPMAP